MKPDLKYAKPKVIVVSNVGVTAISPCNGNRYELVLATKHADAFQYYRILLPASHAVVKSSYKHAKAVLGHRPAADAPIVFALDNWAGPYSIRARLVGEDHNPSDDEKHPPTLVLEDVVFAEIAR